MTMLIKCIGLFFMWDTQTLYLLYYFDMINGKESGLLLPKYNVI